MCHIAFQQEVKMSFTPPIKLIQYLIEHSTDLDIILNSPAFEGINMDEEYARTPRNPTRQDTSRDTRKYQKAHHSRSHF